MKSKIFCFSFEILLVTLLLVLPAPFIIAEEAVSVEKTGTILRAYGPGGPPPAMREAAEKFGIKKGIR